MGRVLTDNTAFAVARESSTAGTLPADPIWHTLEPNDVTNWGATITSTPRDPISKSRQLRKGVTTDLDSGMDWVGDLTREHFLIYADGFMFSSYVGTALRSGSDAGVSSDTTDTLSAVDATNSFDHDNLTAAIPENALVVARGFTNAANNTGTDGVWEVATGGGVGSTIIEAADATLVDETPTDVNNATLEVAGFRFSDLIWTDATNTLSTNAGTIDLEDDIGLSVGQMIQVGGKALATRFSDTDLMEGRVVSLAANAIVLDKVVNVTGTIDGGGDIGAPGEAVDLIFGRFLRNVAVDDTDYLEVSYQYEAAWENLGGGSDEFEYSKGNYANVLQFVFNGQDKALLNVGHVGTDTDPPVVAGSRATNAASPIDVVQSAAFNTSADFLRLRITEYDETGLTSDFKNVTVSIDNQITPEKVLNTLGAKYLNNGNFLVRIEGEALFTKKEVISAIRNDTTVTAEIGISNGDGAIYLDIPQMTLGNGGRSLPRNESVTVALEGTAHGDDSVAVSHSLGISTFPYVSTS